MNLSNLPIQEIGLSTLLLFFIVINNVSSSMMAYVMPHYPSWLLYATTIIYTIGFYLLAIWNGERPFSKENLSFKNQSQFLWLGMWTFLNGLTFQFSDPWISGNLAQLLSMFGIPCVWFLSKFLLKDSFTRYEMIGSSIVIFGIILGSLPKLTCILPSVNSDCNSDGTWKKIPENSHTYSYKSNPPFMVILFIISVAFQAIEQVWQDKAFRKPYQIKNATCLFWYNLYSIPPYIISIFLESIQYINGTDQNKSVQYAWENQIHAFRCFFGDPYPDDTVLYNTTYSDKPQKNCYVNIDGGGIGGATLWPLLFIFGYLGMFYLNAVFIIKYNAFYASVLGTLAAPLAAFVLSWKKIVGDNADPISWYTVVGFLLILIGFLVKGKPNKNDEDILDDNDNIESNLLNQTDDENNLF